MMGRLIQQRGMGSVPTGVAVKSGIETGLTTAAKVDPDPISKAILGIAAGIVSFFNFGYNPQKLADTALTEALIIGFNQAWDQLTGEALPYNCTPGQCGAENVAIFTRSAWPNVPMPGGYPGADIASMIAAFQNAIAVGQTKLQRPESLADYQDNANYVMTLLNQAYTEQQSEAAANPVTGAVSDLTTAISSGNIGSLLPWLLGGFLAYEVLF